MRTNNNIDHAIMTIRDSFYTFDSDVLAALEDADQEAVKHLADVLVRETDGNGMLERGVLSSEAIDAAELVVVSSAS